MAVAQNGANRPAQVARHFLSDTSHCWLRNAAAGANLAVAVSLSNIAPGLAIMLLAFAYLEEDSALLIIALIAALASFATTGATVWAAIRTTGWLDRIM